VFGGALGVGIGLGLQKLAANYIAGFTILLDKSVQLGDLVTVDNRNGIVTAVTSRYVVVQGLDGVEAIVPNETLVTTTVLKHSSSARRIRVAIPVRITYQSDVERALTLLEDAARAEPRVLRDATLAPQAFVSGLGEFGVDLELGVWIADPEGGQLGLRSSINRRVLRSFAEDRGRGPGWSDGRPVRLGLVSATGTTRRNRPGNNALAAPVAAALPGASPSAPPSVGIIESCPTRRLPALTPAVH
jgi:small-conductance mechanosensitive channel